MRVILRRVPKKTNHVTQHKMMESWYEVIVEKYAPQNSVPVMRTGKTTSVAESKKAVKFPKANIR